MHDAVITAGVRGLVAGLVAGAMSMAAGEYVSAVGGANPVRGAARVTR